MHVVRASIQTSTFSCSESGLSSGENPSTQRILPYCCRSRTPQATFTLEPEWIRYGHSAKGDMVNSRQLHRLICCRSYETARKIKQQQDEYCDRALSGDWNGLGSFPDDLQWEALVDVLRGRVKVRRRVSTQKFTFKHS